MGFLKPELPVVDFERWSRGSWEEKIRPMATGPNCQASLTTMTTALISAP